MLISSKLFIHKLNYNARIFYKSKLNKPSIGNGIN